MFSVWITLCIVYHDEIEENVCKILWNIAGHDWNVDDSPAQFSKIVVWMFFYLFLFVNCSRNISEYRMSVVWAGWPHNDEKWKMLTMTFSKQAFPNKSWCPLPPFQSLYLILLISNTTRPSDIEKTECIKNLGQKLKKSPKNYFAHTQTEDTETIKVCVLRVRLQQTSRLLFLWPREKVRGPNTCFSFKEVLQ